MKKNELNLASHKNIAFNMPNIFLILFFMADALGFFRIIHERIMVAAYLLVGLCAIMYTVYRTHLKQHKPFLLFSLVYTFFGAVGILANGNMDLHGLLWPIATHGLVLVLLNFNINVYVTRVMYYVVVISLVLKMMISGGADYLAINTSRNGISTLILFYLCLYFIGLYKNKHRVSIIPIFIGLIVAVMGVGRSGILTFIILTGLFILFSIKVNWQSIKRLNVIIGMVILVCIMFTITTMFFHSYIDVAVGNFDKRGLKSIRVNIWYDYLMKILESSKNFFLGASIEGTPLLDNWSTNLHNTFLMLHSKYGLFVLIIVVILAILAFKNNIKKGNYTYVALLAALLFRMQFDYIGFNGVHDIILLYFLFEPYPTFSSMRIKLKKKYGWVANKPIVQKH